MSRLSGALTLYRMEIRALLRDRRTILLSIVLPLLLMPFILGASSRIKKSSAEQAERRSHAYAIAEGPLREKARALVVEAAAPDGADFVAKEVADPASALREGELDLFIEAITEDEAARRAAKSGAQSRGDSPLERPPDAKDPPADVVLLVHYRDDRPASRAALAKAQGLLSSRRDEIRRGALAERGFRVESLKDALPITLTDVATEAERSGSRTGRYLTALVLLFMLVGGGSIASDSIAGEKERGTLETLLSAGAGRPAILASKLLVVLTATLATTLVQVGNLYVWLGLGVADAPAEVGAHVTWGTALLLMALLLPVSALVSSVLVLTFGFAGSYKESQLYFLPLTIVGPVLALAPALPGIELRSAIVIVPLVNISVAIRDVMLGEVDVPMIAASIFVTTAAAVQIARLAVRLLSAERLLLSSQGVDPRNGYALFRGRVLHWFAALWALVVLASLAGAGMGVFPTLVLGQLVFAAAVAVIVQGYGLDVRRALSLRLPRPAVWPAVIVGAPAGALVAAGLFKLASPALQVSERSVEALSRALFPEGVPVWQLAIMLAVLPPICEELLFRGVLLYGLRGKMRPVWLCVTVGLIFGVFHLALFRLVTTTFLGIVITAVAVMTGSIFPGILWHAINNALPLLLLKYGDESAEPPVWLYGVAAVVLAACLGVIWRSRAPSADQAPTS